MSWYQSKEIKGVSSSPNLVDDKLLFFDKENNLISYDVKSLSVLQNKHFEKSFFLNISDDDIFVYLDNSIDNLHPVTLDLGQVWKAKFGRPAILDQNHIYEQVYERKNKTLQLGVYDRYDSEELWKVNFSNQRFARNVAGKLFITDINFTYFICLDLNTGNESWTHSLPEGEKVEGDIYVYENILVVPSKTGQIPFDKTYLQGIDINTGELLWRRESNIYLYQNKRTGLLHAFGGEVYIAIDPKSGEILIRKEFKGIKEANRLLILSNMCRMGDDGFYFISDYVENHYDCQFGKINTETHEIEFTQKLDVAEGVKADPPIYHKGKIYIKDNLDTLHVYEQE